MVALVAYTVGKECPAHTKAFAEPALAARCDRFAVDPAGAPVRPMLAQKAGHGGHCVLPCAPTAQRVDRVVLVAVAPGHGRVRGHRGHVKTSCVACTNVSRRCVSTFGGVPFTLRVQPVANLRDVRDFAAPRALRPLGCCSVLLGGCRAGCARALRQATHRWQCETGSLKPPRLSVWQPRVRAATHSWF